MIADRRLYLNADKTAVVEEGDAAAAFLLVAGPGDAIPDEYVELVTGAAPTADASPVAARRLYLNADKTAIVDEDAEDASFLLAQAGGSIPAEYVDLVATAAPDLVIAPAAATQPTGAAEQAAAEEAAKAAAGKTPKQPKG